MHDRTDSGPDLQETKTCAGVQMGTQRMAQLRDSATVHPGWVLISCTLPVPVLVERRSLNDFRVMFGKLHVFHNASIPDSVS